MQCAKLLGLEIDKELTFHSHVDKVCKKLSQRIGILRKIRHCQEPINNNRLLTLSAK